MQNCTYNKHTGTILKQRKIKWSNQNKCAIDLVGFWYGSERNTQERSIPICWNEIKYIYRMNAFAYSHTHTANFIIIQRHFALNLRYTCQYSAPQHETDRDRETHFEWHRNRFHANNVYRIPTDGMKYHVNCKCN